MSRRPVVLMIGPDVRAIGGIGSVALTLDKGADELGEFDVRLLNSGGGRGPSGWRAWPTAIATARRQDCDIMHLHVASRGSTWRKATFAALARARGIPYVVHLHGASYAEFVNGLKRPQLAAVRRLFDEAERVITLGEVWREFVIERLLTEPDRTVVVTNGVEEVPREAATPTIVHLGELSRRKGVDVLLEAARTVLTDHPEWRLVLVGPTPEPELVERANELNVELGDLIEVVGPKHGDQKLPYLSAASIFVLASRQEGLPMAMLEAMSAGLPVVVTPVGANAEVITDQVNGRMVPPADVTALTLAIDELVREPDLRSRLGTAGRETWQQRFSGQAMVEGVQQVWRESLGDPSQAATRLAGGPHSTVTVIIPTLGRESLLTAVESARSQATEDLSVRIVVVNDSGTPLSAELGDGVTVVDTAGRTGAAAARNRGLDHVEGDWFALLDDDDSYRPGHLASAVATLREQRGDVHFCRGQVHRGARSRVEPAELLDGGSLRDYYLGLANWRSRSRRVLTPTLVVSSRYADHRFDESMSASEDTWWLLGLEAEGARVVSSPAVGVDVHADVERDDQRRSSTVQPLEARLAEHSPALLPGYLVGREGRRAARAGDPAEVLRVARKARAAGGREELVVPVAAELGAACLMAVAHRAKRR